MITYTVGNIFDTKAGSLVNPVNCEGPVSDLAAQFKRVYPGNYDIYRTTCATGWLRPGRVLPVVQGNRIVFNVPTKDDPWLPSRIEWVRSGLETLAGEINRLGLPSVAIPPLGCGRGGLRWEEVRPHIEEVFAHLSDVKVVVYLPSHKLPGGKWLVPVGTPGAVYCGRGRGREIPVDPSEEGHWGNPVQKGYHCSVCKGIHNTNAETLPCYAKYLYQRLEDDVWAEGFLQMMEGNDWFACFCYRHNCPDDYCISPACHTRVMAAIHATEGAKLAARLRQ